ncbi:MAG: uridine monophosphate kinase [Proteobacteria bacterium]|nr:uridine monophosphate kinase [Pseudomonadota bacterium]
MRILLKLSGEVLGGPQGLGLDAQAIGHFATLIGHITAKHQVAIVTGGGNILRGKSTEGIDRSMADQIGMMATVINAMTLQQHLLARGYMARTFSDVPSLAEPYVITHARAALDLDAIVLVAGGTSNPYFTTDSAAALRALELKCDLLIKATKVDGVYDADPFKNKDAKRFETLTFQQAIDSKLGVMDLTAMVLCQENHLPLRVCAVEALSDIDSILLDNKKSTLVH